MQIGLIYCTWTILSNNLINGSCFNVVDNVVAGSRDEMTIGKYVYSILCTAQHMLLNLSIYKVFYSSRELLAEAFVLLFSIASIDSVPYHQYGVEVYVA